MMIWKVEGHETGKGYEHMVMHEKKLRAWDYDDSSIGQTCEEGNTHDSSKND